VLCTIPIDNPKAANKSRILQVLEDQYFHMSYVHMSLMCWADRCDHHHGHHFDHRVIPWNIFQPISIIFHSLYIIDWRWNQSQKNISSIKFESHYKFLRWTKFPSYHWIFTYRTNSFSVTDSFSFSFILHLLQMLRPIKEIKLFTNVKVTG
jgi:hypothetical protein